MADSPIETRLWLLRHPEPEHSVSGRCYGSLDVNLSAEGIRQSHSLAIALGSEPFAAVYTSPLERCRRAAEILTAGRDCLFEPMDALREIDFGEFEGRSYDEIAALYPDLYRQWMASPTEVQFPGGECFAEMRARVLPAVHRIRQMHEGRSLVLVTHGGVIRIVLAEALGMEPWNIFRIAQRYGSLNLIRYFGDDPTVEFLNAVATAVRT